MASIDVRDLPDMNTEEGRSQALQEIVTLRGLLKRRQHEHAYDEHIKNITSRAIIFILLGIWFFGIWIGYMAF